MAAALLIATAGCGSDHERANLRVTEIQLPDRGGSTHELALGPDGNVWVTQQEQAKLVRVTPEGDVRVHSLPSGSGPHGIGFDQRGDLWLTFEFANEIVALNRAGQILERYPIPKAGAGPHGLHVARDGDVWWTGKAGNVVGRLNPNTGRMSVFPVPHEDSKPIYIAEGCDGMYFTERDGARIGRVTDAGVITEWPTPTRDSLPIAVAPHDCRVWFSEEAGHRYGVLDPSTGRIVEYPLVDSSDELASLAFDVHGTLWLQHVKPDAFGRAGPDREVEQFSIPTKNATMHRLIAGPDGRMWFTELATDKVGYFEPQD